MTSLLQALLAVQGAAPTIPKDKTNPHFGSRYAGLDTIVETVGPILNQNGLVWVTLPSYNAETGAPELRYQLVHAKSGEQIDGTMPLLLGKADSQGLGSALTYARRYALAAVLNLVADDDDDGIAAAASGPSAARAPGRPSGKPSEPQLKLIKTLVTQKRATPPQLKLVLERIGAEGVEVKEGWMEQLTAGKEGTASALITYLKEQPLPDPDHPSDVPSDGGFDVPPSDTEGLEVPWDDA